MADVVERANTYEADEHAWLAQQAAVLRSGNLDRLDRENLAAYLADMAKRDRRELQSRLIVLALHIIKFQAQSDRISSSWRASILTQQSEIEQIINDSQSLKNEVPAMLPKVLRDAFRLASVETGMRMDDLHNAMAVIPELTLAHMLSFDVTLPASHKT